MNLGILFLYMFLVESLHNYHWLYEFMNYYYFLMFISFRVYAIFYLFT